MVVLIKVIPPAEGVAQASPVDAVESAERYCPFVPTARTPGVDAAVAESSAPLAVNCPLLIASVNGTN